MIIEALETRVLYVYIVQQSNTQPNIHLIHLYIQFRSIKILEKRKSIPPANNNEFSATTWRKVDFLIGHLGGEFLVILIWWKKRNVIYVRPLTKNPVQTKSRTPDTKTQNLSSNNQFLKRQNDVHQTDEISKWHSLSPRLSTTTRIRIPSRPSLWNSLCIDFCNVPRAGHINNEPLSLKYSWSQKAVEHAFVKRPYNFAYLYVRQFSQRGVYP